MKRPTLLLALMLPLLSEGAGAKDSPAFLNFVATRLGPGPLDPSKAPPSLREILATPAFHQAMGTMVARMVLLGGEKPGATIDHNLPRHLGTYVSAHDLPFAEIITADYCVAKEGRKIPCDSGAPYGAGLLTSRAFLSAYASAYNMKRTIQLMATFLCEAIPTREDLQPKLPRDRLVPLLQGHGDPSQGGGAPCYQCHGQFAPIAQLFVRFDELGVWQKDADGAKDPEGMPGHSRHHLFASQLIREGEKAREGTPEIFGVGAGNLREAALAIAGRPEFRRCMVKHGIAFALNMDDEQTTRLATYVAMIERIASRIGPESRFADLMASILSDERIRDAIDRYEGG